MIGRSGDPGVGPVIRPMAEYGISMPENRYTRVGSYNKVMERPLLPGGAYWSRAAADPRSEGWTRGLITLRRTQRGSRMAPMSM